MLDVIKDIYLDSFIDNPDERIMHQIKTGESWASVDRIDGKCLLIGGMYPYWAGVAEAWVKLSPDFYDYKFTAIKDIKTAIKYGVSGLGLHRLQSFCIDDEVYKNFLGLLGFSPGGRIRQYLPDGSDAILYEMIF